MMTEYMSFYPPTEQNIIDVVKGFEVLGFPQCMGAIDGCHIEVSPKEEEAVDYYNYKGWYSVVLLAVCDHRCKFTYINVGSPGRNNDSYILQHSLLDKELRGNNIYAKLSRTICGVDVPLLLIADSAFALSKYIMKPFPYISQQIPSEKNYNYVLSKCRRVIENSFGQLKARFRRLLKGLEVNVENTSAIIKACCILHNFLKENDDELANWTEELTEMDQRPQPSFSTTVGNNHSAGINIRKAIAEYIEGTGSDDVEAEVDVDAAELNHSIKILHTVVSLNVGSFDLLVAWSWLSGHLDMPHTWREFE